MLLFRKIYNKVIVRSYLKLRLGSVGLNFRYGFSSCLINPELFTIGNNFFSGPFSYFSTNKDTAIKIGNDVMFGPDCKVIGGNHNIRHSGSSMMQAPYLGGGKGIIIEDDNWIGAGATLLDGAYLSEGCVLAAGAVLSTKTKPYSIYGGVPAKFIKFRFSKEEIKNLNPSNYTIEQIIDYYD